MTCECINDPPYDELEDLALACGYSVPAENRRHVGILYRNSEGKLKILHQPWHYRSLAESPKEEYLWLEPNSFRTDELQMIAAQCVAIADSNREGIPYAFEMPSGKLFDEDGEFLLTNAGQGLTCATFVAAVFKSLAYDIVDISTWEPRSEDEEELRKIFCVLENHSDADDEHLEAVRHQQECARLRPEEVAGAGISDNRPVCFEDGQRYGEIVLHELETRKPHK